MSSITPVTFSFYATQIINRFNNSRNSANHDNVERLSANGEIQGDCFSVVESLFV